MHNLGMDWVWVLVRAPHRQIPRTTCTFEEDFGGQHEQCQLGSHCHSLSCQNVPIPSLTTTCCLERPVLVTLIPDQECDVLYPNKSCDYGLHREIGQVGHNHNPLLPLFTALFKQRHFHECHHMEQWFVTSWGNVITPFSPFIHEL